MSTWDSDDQPVARAGSAADYSSGIFPLGQVGGVALPFGAKNKFGSFAENS